MWLLAGVGAILAGLFMLVRQGAPLLKAKRTGVLISTAHGAPRIERSADPERFERFMKTRTRALGGPLIAIVAGLGWLGWNFLGLYLRG